MIRSVLSFGLCSLAFSLAALAATNSASPEISPTTVIADVDGMKLTLGEFEQKRADSLFQARDAFYHQERKVLEDYLDDYLLKREAQKQNLTVDQLLDREVKSKLPKDPSEEALHVYYEGMETKDTYEALRSRILDHIRQARFDKAKAAYVASLRSQANIVISLPPPRAEIRLENTPVLGAQNAPVLFVEYADFECPYCQQVAPTIQRLETEYKGKVKFAFKDTPLPMHPHAQKAAEAAHCAGLQGKYWDYHNALFATKQLAVPDLKAEARKLNLDGAAFDKCLDTGAEAATVKAQLEEANALGVQGTPSFFINGRFLSGAASYETLHEAIEQELTTAQPKETARR